MWTAISLLMTVTWSWFVVEKTPDYLLCEVQNEATLGSRKSVNVPGVRINLPFSDGEGPHQYPLCH